MRGNSVRLEPGSGLTPQVIHDMNAVADSGDRFRVPSVGLDVPLGALDMTHGTITPPGFASAYDVRNLGVPLSQAPTGTVFVATHSLRNGAVGPGNYLIDVKAQKAKVAVGATIDVADVAYSVTGAKAIGKLDISSDADVWANVPGRLVVITCLQRRDGRASTQNMVITAQLDAH
ncbi:class F sortase [Gryllotalpicola protaetiae]|nr:class F sortase [Gryllotalpicola protaetiae]